MNRPAISFTAPYRVYLPDEFFNVQTPNGSSMVKALPLPPVVTPNSPQVHGAGFEVEHDIFGFAGRTRFYVVLSTGIDLSQPDWKMDVCNRDRDLVEEAINAVNRLLAVYRDRDVNSVGVRSFHVIELVRGDVSDIELVIIDNNSNRIEDFVITWPGFRSMGFGSATDRTDDVVAAIRSDLATNAGIPLERELISSAHNHLWRKQLRIVPIEANTAFETFVLTVLARLNPHLVLHERTEFINKLKAIESAMVAACSAKSHAFTPWFDSSVQGYAGMHNAELRRWHQECYLLRNCQVALFLLSTGARLSEALQAQWSQIDRQSRVWRIPATNSKSKRIRAIPLNDSAIEVLDRLGTEGKFDHLFINLLTEERLTAVNKVWGRLRVKAGLPHLRLHDLRHQFASFLVNAGHTIYEVQKILGHSDTKVTERYAHLSLGSLQKASNSASIAMKGAGKGLAVVEKLAAA